MKKSLLMGRAIASLAACAAGPPHAALDLSTNEPAAAAKTKAGVDIMTSTNDAPGAGAG